MAASTPGNEEEEDDYLSMTFADTTTPAPPKETSLQRTARLKKEAAARSLPLSKAELEAQAQANLETGLATSIDSSNRGAQMLARMGFKGGGLGKTEGARTRPIELEVKGDRGGIGMDSEKKRKVREAAEEAGAGGGEKRAKVGVEEFRVRRAGEREERRAEGLVWGAMRVLEGLGEDEKEGEGDDVPTTTTGHGAKKRRLRGVNILYRPLVRQRLERERDRKMRYDLNNSLSTRNDNDDDEDESVFDKRVEELEDADPELEEFEALSFAEKLERITKELREKYRYCFWCKFRYPDAEMEGCPGLTEDEHG
ncbi:hypothetical protein BDY17DRAFT_310865 [Neohortaea acidophila]|uniref:G-patch domain-containing protein n=1 Tax=Neohortaea acidophila TaxID=245834 RepID=A0A6A6PQZ4_9PEZI|nr:uncharacterized protein BDY17DRAFT_310865 [Neohortaea acidophila]KAF2482365.1 hypothetical protein BDY17DRAFT_310865 [Neohortaea acidophila]